MTEQFQVLAVDDTPLLLQLLTALLDNEGYQVRVALDGEAALASATADPPDLILLDVQMPGLTGHEVCRRLKADASLKDIPVIFLSAASETRDIVKGFAAGGADYVTKPFTHEVLLARVRTHLEFGKVKADQDRLIAELQEALEEVKVLSALVPICGHCKKIRNDGGFWQQMEGYIESRSLAKFTPGICPDCIEAHYPDIALARRERQAGERP